MVMLDIIPDTEITTAGTRVKVYTRPSGKVVYIKNLTITNLATADATVEIFSGDTTDTGTYRILTVKVTTGTTLRLSELEVGGRKAIHDIYVQTDQQPIRVSGTVEVR